MSGPRKRSIQAGLYAAGSLGSVQDKRSVGFRVRHCNHANHAWIFGDESAVCTKCGKTVPKGEVQQ